MPEPASDLNILRGLMGASASAKLSVPNYSSLIGKDARRDKLAETVKLSSPKLTPSQAQSEAVVKINALLANSLKESLSGKAKSVMGGWKDIESLNGGPALQASYVFDSAELASAFSEVVLSHTRYSHYPTSVTLNLYGKKPEVKLELQTLSQKQVTDSDISLANWLNYVFYEYQTRYSSSGVESYWYRTSEKPDDKQVFTSFGEGLQYKLSEQENEDGKVSYFVEVPMVRLGSWKHAAYGVVEFTQEDFTTILSNWKSNALGYEPKLTRGHVIEEENVFGGIPADGFLTDMWQDGEVLYGKYEVLEPQVYTDIQKGRYRYASVEVLRNFTDREGNAVGPVLLAVALTNEPFVPGLPQVQALAEKQQVCLSYRLAEATNPKPQSETMPEQGTVATNVVAEIQTQLDTIKASYADQLDALKTAMEAEVASRDEEINELKTQLSQLQDEKRQVQVEGFISRINALSLPVEKKEMFAENIRNGVYGDSVASFVEGLESVDTQRLSSVTKQHGDASSQEEATEEIVDPYAAIKQRYNHKRSSSEAELNALLLKLADLTSK